MPDVPPSHVLIGGFDRTGTYLLTPITYDLVCEHKCRAGAGRAVEPAGAGAMLEQDGLLVSTDRDGRQEAVVRVINGQRVRWWHVPANLVPRS